MKKTLFVMLVVVSFALSSAITFTPVVATTPSPIISINGNSDLTAQASAHSWPGSGTTADPYIIANLAINANNQYAFVVQNTNLHFVFENNTINGGIVGVYFSNVQNAVLKHNTITKTEKFGIMFDESSNNLAVNNTISHTTNGIGVLIANSENNLFNNNTSEYNSNHGFFISQNTTNNTFEYNYAIGNGNDVNSGVGFYVVFANTNSLIGNVAINNTLSGIQIENSANIYLKDNVQIGNGRILKGESRTRILLFIGITVLLVLVAIALTIINKKVA